MSKFWFGSVQFSLVQFWFRLVLFQFDLVQFWFGSVQLGTVLVCFGFSSVFIFLFWRLVTTRE